MSPFLSLANAKQANEGEIEGWLRTKSKHKATKGYANACLWIVCIFLSTKGAYYGAKKQA
jgi:hypothetical protein